MKVAVAFATKHGFTRGIAEFIAEKIRGNGIQAEALDVDEFHNPGDYDAFVVGSAVYMGSWMKQAKKFVRENREVLEQHPVWLFSSGPVGPDQKDKKGREPREVAVSPGEIAELKTIINPRDHRVFFGGYDSKTGGIGGWVIRRLPAANKALIEGDFRNWDEIGNWAAEIAKELVA
jgi:menaquinone-dependent protoporphyrinogen oxidase